MADEQSPTVEIAPTIIVSNSSEGDNNETGNEPGNGSHSDGDGGSGGPSLVDDAISQSEAVAIAEIEAGRDIALATINSDVERERIASENDEQLIDENRNEEIQECLREIARLSGIVEHLSETVNSLIPPLPLAAVVEEPLEIVEEMNLTQPSTAAPMAETLMEPSEENGEENQEEIIPSRGHRFIAI